MRKDHITSKLIDRRRKESPVPHIPWTVLKKEIDEAYDNWCARRGIDPKSKSFNPDYTVKK